MTAYSYHGRVRGSRYHLVHVQFYEGDGYLMVNQRSGWSTFSNGVPVVSPDRQRIAAGNVDLHAEYSPTTLQVWRVAGDTLAVEWEHDFLSGAPATPVWGPGTVRWAAPSEIVVTKEYEFGELGEDVVVHLTASGGWSWVTP